MSVWRPGSSLAFVCASENGIDAGRPKRINSEAVVQRSKALRV